MKFLTTIKKEPLRAFENSFRNLTTPTIGLNEVFANWSFVCINIRAKAVAGTPIQAADYSGSPLNDKHWLNLVIKRPNPIYSMYQLKWLVSAWLDYYGNAYIYTPLLVGNKPGQMYVIPPNCIKLLGDMYLITADTGSFTVSKNEVCHLATLKPSGTWSKNLMGQPMLIEAAANTIGADTESIKFIQNYFINDAVPPFFLMSETTMTDFEAKNFKSWWNQNQKKYPLAGIIEGGKRVEPLISGSQQTMQSVIKDSIETSLVTRIGAVFGIPKAKLLSEYSNRATSDTIEDVFREETIEPINKYIDEQLSNHFSNFEEVSIIHIPYVRVNPDEARADKQFRLLNGISTINDIRKEYSLEPVAGGDEILMQASVRPLQEQTIEIPDTIPDTTKSYKQIPEIKKFTIWKSFEKINSKYEPILISDMKKLYKELHRDILNRIAKKNTKAGLSANLSLSDKEITKLIEKYILKDLENHQGEVFSESYKTVGINEELDFTNTVKKGVDLTTDKIRESINEIQKDLKATIKEIGQENPQATYKELLSKIQGAIDLKFNSYIQWRTKLISRTTVTAQQGYAQNTVWKEEMGLKTVWMSQRDTSVRPSHSKADGQEPDDEGYYSVGLDRMKYPGGGSIAAENCNCQCSLYPME